MLSSSGLTNCLSVLIPQISVACVSEPTKITVAMEPSLIAATSAYTMSQATDSERQCTLRAGLGD